MNTENVPKTNYCISSINEKMFRDNPMQSQQNKPITEHIHSTKKKKKMKFESLFWNYVKWNWRCVPVLMMWTEQSLFWNYVKWNRRYVSVLMMWTFPRLFLTAWFFSRATFRGCCVVHAAWRLFWALQLLKWKPKYFTKLWEFKERRWDRKKVLSKSLYF